MPRPLEINHPNAQETCGIIHLRFTYLPVRFNRVPGQSRLCSHCASEADEHAEMERGRDGERAPRTVGMHLSSQTGETDICSVAKTNSRKRKRKKNAARTLPTCASRHSITDRYIGVMRGQYEC